MMTRETLIDIAREFRALTGIEKESTLSYRVFGDTKKLAALRRGGDITVGRFNQAMQWFVENWPEDAARPSDLETYCDADNTSQPVERGAA